MSVTSTLVSQPFSATAHYKSKGTTLSGSLDDSGRGSVVFDTGSATKGYRVYVDLKVGSQAARREAPPSALFRLAEGHVASRAVVTLARARQAVLESLGGVQASCRPRRRA